MSLFKSSKKKKGKDKIEPWEKKERTENKGDVLAVDEKYESIEQIIPEEAYAYEDPYSVYYHKQPVVPANQNGVQKIDNQAKDDNKADTKESAKQGNIPVVPATQTINGTVPNKGTYPYQAPGKIGKEQYIYKPRINEKKLMILLIENTSEMAKENDSIIKLSEICKETDWLYIVHYGKDVDIKKVELKKFFKKENDIKPEDFKCLEDATEDACLYDALTETTKIVSDLYGKVKEVNKVTTKVSKIEIIGIGTCKDNCSKNSKEDTIKSFCKMLKDTRIKSKYFCLNENSFLTAAEIGFRSIGSISKSYYQHETE